MTGSAINLWDAARRAVERLIVFLGGGPAALAALQPPRRFYAMILERLRAIEELTREAIRAEAARLAGRTRPEPAPAETSKTETSAEAARAPRPRRQTQGPAQFSVTVEPARPPAGAWRGASAPREAFDRSTPRFDAGPLARRFAAVIAALEDPRPLIAKLARRLGAAMGDTPPAWRGEPPTEADWRKRVAALEARPAPWLWNTS
jgi:hypothetical protein